MDPDCLANGCRHEWLTNQVRDLEQNAKDLLETNKRIQQQLDATLTEASKQARADEARIRDLEGQLNGCHRKQREVFEAYEELNDQKLRWIEQLDALSKSWERT